MFKTVCGRSFSLAVAGLLLSATLSPVTAEVTDIRIISTGGSLVVAESFFLPADDPGAHFSIATLGVDEIAGTPTGGPDDLWWDLEIKITRATSQVGEDVMISIDKDVFNNTSLHWTDFHMTLGFGVGAGFMESDEFDGLFFKDNPAPVEHSGAFANPPMFDEPNAPDNLWWFADPPNYPGLPPGGVAVFWLGINVRDSLFDPNDPTMATFTLRQHASIPEPSTACLLACGLGLFLTRRRK